MPSYSFKVKPELVWAVLTAAAVMAVQVIQRTDPNIVTDWGALTIAIAAAVVRAGLGALISAWNAEPPQ